MSSPPKATCVAPTWGTLDWVFEAPETVFVASPWISHEGIEFLEGLLDRTDCENWEVWTRLDILDSIFGYSDHSGLLQFCERAAAKSVSLRAADNLHLKVFWNGADRALVGSCNLTGGGLASNLEAAVTLEGNLDRLIEVLNSHRPHIALVSPLELRAFVTALESAAPLKGRWESLRDEAQSMAKRMKGQRRKPPYFGIR